MKLSGRPFPLIALFVLAPILGVGCGGDDDHAHENPDEEACEHLVGGPFEDLPAAPVRTDGAPPIRDDHKAYRVSLVEGATGKRGFVRFAPDEAGAYIVFTAAPATVSVSTSAGTAVPAGPIATSVAACMAVRGRHVFDLTVGTYHLEIASSDAVVPVVVERGDHAH